MSKPEIYYDPKGQNLVWLPKHSKIIAEVAEELYQSGIHYDSTIRGKGTPRSTRYYSEESYSPYVAWTCFNPKPLLNHPKIKEILMPKFKIGDKVILKPVEELTRPWYKNQEVGVGTIIKDVRGNGPNGLDVMIRWEDNSENSYCSKDLILKETPMPNRTIPSKDQVLEAATSCPQTKEALQILFPQDFEPTPIKNIFEHFAVIKGAILMSPQVQERLDMGIWQANNGCRGPRDILNHPIFEGWYGIYISREAFKTLINDILALSGD